MLHCVWRVAMNRMNKYTGVTMSGIAVFHSKVLRAHNIKSDFTREKKKKMKKIMRINKT